jgi:hypothetical protein
MLTALLNKLKTNKIYIHPLLFAGLYFMVSKICRVAPRIKIHHADPAMDGMIRTVQQFKQIFKPHRTMFRKLREKRRSFHYNVSAKKRKTLKKPKILFGGGGESIIR